MQGQSDCADTLKKKYGLNSRNVHDLSNSSVTYDRQKPEPTIRKLFKGRSIDIDSYQKHRFEHSEPFKKIDNQILSSNFSGKGDHVSSFVAYKEISQRNLSKNGANSNMNKSLVNDNDQYQYQERIVKRSSECYDRNVVTKREIYTGNKGNYRNKSLIVDSDNVIEFKSSVNMTSNIDGQEKSLSKQNCDFSRSNLGSTVVNQNSQFNRNSDFNVKTPIKTDSFMNQEIEKKNGQLIKSRSTSIADIINFNQGNIKINQGNIKINQGDIKINQGDIKIDQGDIKINKGDIKINQGDASPRMHDYSYNNKTKRISYIEISPRNSRLNEIQREKSYEEVISKNDSSRNDSLTQKRTSQTNYSFPPSNLMPVDTPKDFNIYEDINNYLHLNKNSTSGLLGSNIITSDDKTSSNLNISGTLQTQKFSIRNLNKKLSMTTDGLPSPYPIVTPLMKKINSAKEESSITTIKDNTRRASPRQVITIHQKMNPSLKTIEKSNGSNNVNGMNTASKISDLKESDKD